MKSEYIKHRIANIINIQKIVTLHYFEFEMDFASKGESHDFWEMVYADKGELQVSAGNQTFTLLPGECFFHKPNEYHVHRANGKTAPNIFIISFVCNSQGMKQFRGKRIRVPSSLRMLISNIISEGRKTFDLPFNDPDLKQLQLLSESIVGGQQMIRTYLEQFLILLLRYEQSTEERKEFPAGETSSGHIAVRMKEHLDSLVYQNVGVADFCKDMKYSKPYLSKIFMNHYGESIHAYMMKTKIEEAKKLIREHTYNFTQISDMLCFSNPFYFSRVFKQITGMSPTEYKKSVRID